MLEINSEVRDILGERPATQEELVKIQKNNTLSLPGQWETIRAVGGFINEIVRYNLPDDHFQTYAQKMVALKLEDVAAASKTLIHPDNLVWVVVGDREKTEAGIRELELGEIQFLDSDGNAMD